MNCQFFDKNNCHIIIGVNFMTSHKYIYGNITVKDDIDINSDYYIDQNIEWNQFFNQVVVN